MEKIGAAECRKWNEILEKYRNGKAALDGRIIEAEEFWKLRHWRSIRKEGTGDPEPASAWLVNCILSKHSDAVDAYPVPHCLPREAGDLEEARDLSAILPVILEQNDFQKVWSDVWWYKLKSGTGVYGVFWDPRALDGLGDIAIRKVELLNLFWEPGVGDLQDSPYVFYVQPQSREALEAQYPGIRLTLGQKPRQYQYRETISQEDKIPVVDLYYKRGNQLFFCKYVGETVLYASENQPQPQSFYAHGQYPFVFDPLFPEEGYPDCGYGYVDLCKDPQKTIDILNNCFLQSSVASATPRWFIRSDGGVNEAEYGDLTKKFVHVKGRLDTESIAQIHTSPMPANAVDYMQLKINEIKEVSGNRDVNNGSSGAVTAASAIAALQEAGNGLSRDMIASGYRAVRKVVYLCIELMREFYTVPRSFRILGDGGTPDFVQFSNDGLRVKALPDGLRLPSFDIQVEMEKQSGYSQYQSNELAVKLFQMGVFDPARVQQSLLLLSMMDFKGKDLLMHRLGEISVPAMAPTQPAAPMPPTEQARSQARGTL